MTVIHTQAFRRINAGTTGFTVTCTASNTTLVVALNPDERRQMAAALDPERSRPLRGMWIREDLPSVSELAEVSGRACVTDLASGADAALDAVVEHLNKHFPKVPPILVMPDSERPESDLARWRRAHRIVEQERDQARRERDEARQQAATLAHDIEWCQRRMGEHCDDVDAAERDRDEWKARAEAAEKRHTWPKTTPDGHTYVAPDTYAELCHRHSDAAQAEVECWEADECPPEPTWEMVGIAHREVERLQRERDEWNARDTAATRAAQLEKRAAVTQEGVDSFDVPPPPVTTPRPGDNPLDDFPDDTPSGMLHVSAEDIVGVIRGRNLATPRQVADAVMELLSGADPAVHVVRESDVEAQAALRNRFGEFVVNGTVLNVTTAEDCREKAQRHLDAVARCESIARAIEAEAAVDPVEALAEQIETATRAAIRQVCDDLSGVAPSLDPLAVEQAMEVTAASRKVAAHVLGQGAAR